MKNFLSATLMVLATTAQADDWSGLNMTLSYGRIAAPGAASSDSYSANSQFDLLGQSEQFVYGAGIGRSEADLSVSPSETMGSFLNFKALLGVNLDGILPYATVGYSQASSREDHLRYGMLYGVGLRIKLGPRAYTSFEVLQRDIESQTYRSTSFGLGYQF